MFYCHCPRALYYQHLCHNFQLGISIFIFYLLMLFLSSHIIHYMILFLWNCILLFLEKSLPLIFLFLCFNSIKNIKVSMLLPTNNISQFYDFFKLNTCKKNLIIKNCLIVKENIMWCKLNYNSYALAKCAFSIRNKYVCSCPIFMTVNLKLPECVSYLRLCTSSYLQMALWAYWEMMKELTL